jgi:hypothetical protein
METTNRRSADHQGYLVPAVYLNPGDTEMAGNVGPGVAGVVALLSVLMPGPVHAQGDSAIPRIDITSHADLIESLTGSPDLYESRVRLGLIAAQGAELVGALRQIAADGHESDLVRANALSVLGLLHDSSSVSLMIALAPGPGPLRASALNALSMSPYPETCAYWRFVLRNPEGKGGALGVALGGIRFCGNEGDIPLIESVLLWDRTFGAREVAGRTISELRRPVAERYRGTALEGNYPPTGVYRPPPQIAAAIRKQLCAEGCAPGMVLPPSAVARRRDY